MCLALDSVLSGPARSTRLQSVLRALQLAGPGLLVSPAPNTTVLPHLLLPVSPEQRCHLSGFGCHMSSADLQTGGPPRGTGRKMGKNQPFEAQVSRTWSR